MHAGVRAGRPRGATGPGTIVLITHDMMPSGAPTFVLRYGRWLREHGYPVQTVALRGGPLQSEFAKLGGVFDLARMSPADASAKIADLSKIAMVAHANTSVVGDVSARFDEHGTPVVTHVHESPFYLTHSSKPEALRAMEVATSQYVTVSEFGRNALQRACPTIDREKITVVRGSVPEPSQRLTRAEARARLGIDQDAFVVVGIGGPGWTKGTDKFIAVANNVLNLRDDPNNVLFRWIGHTTDFSLTQYKYECDSLPPGAFTFTGETNDVGTQLDAANVLVVASPEETLSLVMLEAAMREIPTVAFSGVGGPEEFINDGKSGRIFRIGDTSAMADFIVAAAQDHAIVNELGRAAREQIGLTWPTFDEMAAELLKIDVGAAIGIDLRTSMSNPVLASEGLTNSRLVLAP